MASVKEDITLKEYQSFVKEVYGLPNDRCFNTWDMISNMERFIMRGLKGIRKGDKEKIKINVLIAMSWFMSIMNQLHIDIEDEVWKRFPYLCSYCASCPCSCGEKKIETRQSVPIDESKRPKTMGDFQQMLERIYPPEKRTLDHAGVHMAEEVGEFSEAMLTFRGRHREGDFKNVKLEAADLFTNILGVFNSLNMSAAKELSLLFHENCHICHNAPCICDFKYITDFKS